MTRPLSSEAGANLRIDNCSCSVICAFGRISETNLGIETYVTSNKRTYFSQSDDINKWHSFEAVIKENVNLKPIFTLLFFEHGYLA